MLYLSKSKLILIFLLVTASWISGVKKYRHCFYSIRLFGERLRQVLGNVQLYFFDALKVENLQTWIHH